MTTIIFSAVLAIVVAAFYVVLTLFVIPDFESLWSDATASLPKVTEIAFSTYMYWNVFGIFSLIGAFLIANRRGQLGWTLLIIGAASIVIVIPFFVNAMYAPIMQLAGEI